MLGCSSVDCSILMIALCDVLFAVIDVSQVKVCSFAEHSPMLNDITAVKTWQKVNEGLIKMYKAEVLGKFAVVQHFIYSSWLPRDPQPASDAADMVTVQPPPAHAHAHAHSTGKVIPCCSDAIRFPSVLAAKKDELRVPVGP